jgi:hypothetical protein
VGTAVKASVLMNLLTLVPVTSTIFRCFVCCISERQDYSAPKNIVNAFPKLF